MATPSTSDLEIGARCEVGGQSGIIRYIGTTDFAPGKWVGVELDGPSGKNDGSVKGKHYFDCKPNHGVFVRASQVKIPSNSAPTLRTPSTPSFAPPNANDAAPLRQRPTSMIFPSSNRNSISGIPNRLSRGPGSFGFPRGPNSPTFQKRPRGYSDASNPDQKRLDFDSLYFNQQDNQDLNEDYPENDEHIDDEYEAGASTLKSDLPKHLETPRHDTADAPDPFSLQETREQTVSQKEYDELRMKLKILENKRQEDRERIREADKMKAEAEQILSVKPKLQVIYQSDIIFIIYILAKMAEMQQELRDLRKQLKEVNSEKEAFEGKYNEASESMEIMAIDKEVAEEKADQLQQEVNLLKEKIEEISVDLTVFKKHERLSDETRQAIEYVQLEKQNERLKEALFSESEADLNKKIKALEKELSSLQDIQAHRDQLKNQLDHAEMSIEDLKSRLDDVMHNEDMLEQLTQQNLLQGEQIEEMKMTIDDLEALKELNDELEESHIENEKQLQAEIDTLIREYLRRIESTDEANADYENTITNFRELVATDLEQFRRKEENQNSGTDNLGSESQKMLDLKLQLSNTELKNQAKQIDLELRKLDATQATEHLAFVQLRQKLAWFSDLSKRFITFINGCPVETFLNMGQVYRDLIGTEHTIVDLLRKEELKESENIDKYFAERYLSDTKIDEADKFYSYGRALDLNADTIAVTLGQLKQAVATACKDEGTKDELKLVGLHQIIYTVTENILSINEMKMWEGCTKTLQDLCQEIVGLNNVINDPDKAETAPWVIRSKELKAEVIINVDMERKLQQSGEKIQELLKDMKLKADRINSLEEELANKTKQESDLEEVMGKLHQDLETRTYVPIRIIGSIINFNFHILMYVCCLTEIQTEPQHHHHHPEDVDLDDMEIISETSPLETQRLTSQIESLKFAVRYLRAENSHLKGKDALSVLNWHLQPKRSRSIQNQNNSEHLSNIAQEAKSLLKQRLEVKTTTVGQDKPAKTSEALK
ncbi:19297_t:CDS:10, partial [Racocetra fulgida]